MPRKADDPFYVRGDTVWFQFSDRDLARKLGRKSARFRGSTGLVVGTHDPKLYAEIENYKRRLIEEHEQRARGNSLPALEAISELRDHERHRLVNRPATWAKYKYSLTALEELINHTGVEYISDLTAQHFEAWAARQITGGRKPGGIESYLREFSVHLKRLSTWGHFPDYSPELMSTCRTNMRALAEELRRDEFRTLADDEIAVLISDDLMGDIFSALLYSGQRVGRILRLQRQDVGEETIVWPVSKRRRHEQVISEDMRSLVESLKNRNTRGLGESQYLFWRDVWTGDPESFAAVNSARSIVNHRMQRVLIKNFYSERLKQDNPDTKKKWTRRELIRKYNIPCTHRFRATCAERLLDAGMLPHHVRLYIGWKDFETYYKKYQEQRAQKVKVVPISINPSQPFRHTIDTAESSDS